MSRAEMRFQRFQTSQQMLFEAEERLSKRMEAERKANEEFDQVQLELQRLGDEKITVVCITFPHRKCI
jgi:hypothetical protein